MKKIMKTRKKVNIKRMVKIFAVDGAQKVIGHACVVLQNILVDFYI